jgi:hypothetical protein
MKELNERLFHKEVALDSFKLYKDQTVLLKRIIGKVILKENFELNRAVAKGFLF